MPQVPAGLKPFTPLGGSWVVVGQDISRVAIVVIRGLYPHLELPMNLQAEHAP